MEHKHRWLIGALVVVALAGLTMIAPGEEGAIAEGGIIYVDADAEGANDGTSWTDARTDLQDALDMAGLGDQIRVAAGIYKPTHEFTAGNPRSASFQLMNGVEIYGGFDPTVGATEWEDRDWVTHPTILSGDLNGDDGPDFANNGDNSYHVFYHGSVAALDSSAILDGFTIAGGNANYLEEWPHFYGGGMFNYASSPALSNCTFEGNSSAYVGGGMANGGYSSPTLINCTFRGNWADSEGGGIYNWDYSSPTLDKCTLEGNSANYGGGMYNAYGASPVLTDCTFEGNSATERGGGMYNWYDYDFPPILINCTFWGNSAGQRGGGMFNYNSSPTLTNCTLGDNSAVYGGGGISNYNSSPVVTNAILWGDSPEEIYSSDLFSSPLVTYSNVQGGYPGDGNIFLSPLFVDAGGGDFHLGPGSPCVDVGSNTAPYLPGFDFEGDDRILDGDGDEIAIVDMGVDEFYSEPPPPVIYVDVDATGANSGASWADALTTLQPALSWAVEGVEIWVAEGTYKPIWEFSPGDPRSASFQMKNGVEIYGGFDPTLGDDTWEERDWVNNVTILSGDLGLEDYPLDNSYHVFYHPSDTGLNGSAILDGFTISGGNANGYSPNSSGGGMYNDGSSPTVSNCTFADNSASYGGGGGMWNVASSPTLTDVIFWGNSTSGSGGGMVNDYGASPSLTNCVFKSNSAGWAGGGMANYDNSPVLINCTFFANSAGSNGGGMYNFFYGSPTMTGCTFEGNSATFGGGLYNGDNSSPVLTGCVFDGNSALDSGGGMWNINNSSPALTNCTFSGNSADYGGGMNNDASSPVLTNCSFERNSANQGNGGGMYNWNSSSPVLTNCTFYGNLAYAEGGGVFNHFNSSAALTNCILWGNDPNQIANDASTPVVTYCDVQGGYTGEGNISADPLFVDAANGDFHLGEGSLCIDAGNNDVPNLPLYDFEGDDRILDGDGDGTAIVDMGVDEAVCAGPPVVEVEIDVRPGSEQNPINLGAGGVVPVAILTTEEFDASTVRPASVLFAGAAPRRWTREDVDRDGDEDLLLNFRIQDLDLGERGTEAEVTLTGETFPWAGGVAIEGTDTVRIVP